MQTSNTKGKTMKKFFALFLTAIMGLLCLTACGNTQAERNSETVSTQEATLEDSPEWVAKLPEASDAKQLFIVAGVGDTTAYVSMHQKGEDGKWKQIITTPGYIGKKGLFKTKEGDAKTPVGIFKFNYAFGIAPDPGCSIPYQQVGDDDYWSGDTAYHYNEMVKLSDYPQLKQDDSEHIVDYQVHYQYCLNISYNETGEPGLGSAIFLHCLGPQKPYTGGCVAIPKDKMETVMKNVSPDCVVVINTLQEIAPDLYKEWDL